MKKCSIHKTEKVLVPEMGKVRVKEEGREEEEEKERICQQEKVWNITKAFLRRRFLEFQGWHPAMVRVVGVIMVVGEEAAVAVGTRIPGKLPVASLNLHCPHERMMEKSENKRTREEGKVTELHKQKRSKKNENKPK